MNFTSFTRATGDELQPMGDGLQARSPMKQKTENQPCLEPYHDKAESMAATLMAMVPTGVIISFLCISMRAKT
uniref:Uncharacterized protein n=1 Tax=Romanomermis culicivorax TaxID=13658 RepID=A0A915IXX1_ROMCU